MVVPSGEEARYEVLCTIPFTSTRKRMSVIVRLPTQDRRILLLCKGADNVITDRSARQAGRPQACLQPNVKFSSNAC